MWKETDGVFWKCIMEDTPDLALVALICSTSRRKNPADCVLFYATKVGSCAEEFMLKCHSLINTLPCILPDTCVNGGSGRY